MKFSTFKKSRLSSGAHFEVMGDFSNLAFKLISKHETLKDAYKEFSDALETEDKYFKVKQGSEQTPLIKEARDARDSMHAALKHVAKALTTYASGTQQAAAARIYDVFKLYKYEQGCQYDKSIGVVANEIQDMQEADIEAIGMSYVFEQMTTANNKMRQAIVTRNAAKATIEKAALRKAIKATNEKYDNLTCLIEAQSLLPNNEDVVKFITEWNTNVERIRLQITNKPSKKEDEEPDPEDKTQEDTSEDMGTTPDNSAQQPDTDIIEDNDKEEATTD